MHGKGVAMMERAAESRIQEIASSNDSIYDAMLSGTLECAQDLVERVADTGASSLEREVEFAGQVWTVAVRLKAQ